MSNVFIYDCRPLVLALRQLLPFKCNPISLEENFEQNHLSLHFGKQNYFVKERTPAMCTTSKVVHLSLMHLKDNICIIVLSLLMSWQFHPLPLPPPTPQKKNVRCFCCVELESTKHLLSLLLSTAGRLQLEVQSRHSPAESRQKGLRVPETVQLEAWGRCVPPLDCRAGEDMKVVNCLRCWSAIYSLVIMISPRFHS